MWFVNARIANPCYPIQVFLVTRKISIMKVDELNKAKIPVVKINKKLEEFRGKILFPKKLALANEMLSKAKLPILETSK